MAILSSKNGKFYEVPDGDLKKYELPAEKVKEVLAGMGGEGGPGVEPYGMPGGPAQVIIHVGGGAAVEAGGPPPQAEAGGVEPYGYYGGGYGGYGYGYPYWGWRRRRYYYGY